MKLRMLYHQKQLCLVSLDGVILTIYTFTVSIWLIMVSFFVSWTTQEIPHLFQQVLQNEVLIKLIKLCFDLSKPER